VLPGSCGLPSNAGGWSSLVSSNPVISRVAVSVKRGKEMAMNLRSLLSFFGCKHRDPMFDRVKGVSVWRCRHCLLVLERTPAQGEAQ
jgi:hypothetical protein